MGISDKKILFGGAGGAGAGTPWGTLGEITGRALAPLGFELEVERASWGPNNPRYVSDGRVDFGATQLSRVKWAYEGTSGYAGEGPRPNLRVIACINQPGWVAIAVRWETGITDLAQVKERRLPLRIYDRMDESLGGMIWEYYGLSREQIESWGGRFIPGIQATPGLPNVRGEWARSGNFDLIIDNIYTSYAPEIRHWHDATVLYNLRFLEFPAGLAQSVADAIGGETGHIPHNLYRGIDRNLTAPTRGPQAIYGRDDMPEDFAYLLAKALDDGRHLFREVHLPYSYDPKNVALTKGVPLHPGAERYYREMGYLK